MKKEFSTLNFKNGVKDGLPIGLGYLAVSIAFGVQASLSGMPVLIALLMSMTNLTSAGQLAGLEVIASCGTIVELIIVQLVINARYFLMSVTLSQKADKTFTITHRMLCSFAITDEVFGVAASKPQKIGVKYYYGLMLLPPIGWTTGTLIGAVAGNVLPAFVASALGIALYSMFIAIILPPPIKHKGVLFAVIFSAVISCVLYYVPLFSAISSGMAIIISAVISSAVTSFIFPVPKEEDYD